MKAYKALKKVNLDRKKLGYSERRCYNNDIKQGNHVVIF